jgi:hypothetical protein
MKKLLLSCAVLAVVAPASANVLTPGPGSFSPDSFPSFPSGSIIASIIDNPFTSSLGAGDFTGVYSTWVVRTAGGTLDFVYKFTDTGGEQDVNRVTGSNYIGFTTDVGDAGAGVSPTSVDRVTASPVGFNFSDGIGSGESSNFLIVDTNATTFKPGHLSFINDGAATEIAFGPSAIPEPSTWGMMLLGFLALGWAASRRGVRNGSSRPAAL